MDNAQHCRAARERGARDAAERGGSASRSNPAARRDERDHASAKHIADIITDDRRDRLSRPTRWRSTQPWKRARAGEQRRGFSAVAAEVRTPRAAQRRAAKEIRGLIADSSAKVEAGVPRRSTTWRNVEQPFARRSASADGRPRSRLLARTEHRRRAGQHGGHAAPPAKAANAYEV